PSVPSRLPSLPPFPYTTLFRSGVWPDAYYISFNMFNGTTQAFLGAKVCAFDRNQMLTASGTPGAMQCFQLGTNYGGLLPSDLDGDRKSTRLNSSHQIISYAVFC